MEPILDMIPGDDLQEFDILRKMILDDFLDNEASARSWINRLVQKFSEKLNSGMMKLAETLDKIDLEDIKSMIDKSWLLIYNKIVETQTVATLDYYLIQEEWAIFATDGSFFRVPGVNENINS